MWPRFGLKTGNSTICLASLKDDGKVDVIANKHGDRVSPAVLLAVGSEIEVGLTAKQKMPSKASASVCNSFQFLITDMDEEQTDSALKHVQCNFNKDIEKFELKSQNDDSALLEISPYAVTVELLKASFELARQSHLSEEHPSVVLSIPLYYPAESRSLLAKAAEEVGFHVAQIVPEPTAAVLAYDLGRPDENKCVLCIKSGGLLTSFTLFEINNGLYSVIDSTKPYFIGGCQFTDVIVEFISSEFFRKYKLDPNESRRSMAKIRNSAEYCKHNLSTLQTTQVYIDSLIDGIDYNAQLSRPRYESLIQPVLNKFMTTLSDALKTINKDNRKIDEIVLAGGTMKIPLIQSQIKNQFPDAQLYVSHSPDEVVAIGCAKQAQYIDTESVVLEPDMEVNALKSNVYVWHANNSENQQLVFKQGTILPQEMTIDVEQEDTENAECIDHEQVFHVQTNDIVGDIVLFDIKPMNGVFRIKAKIKENEGRPEIILSCV